MEQDLKLKAKYSQSVLDHQTAKFYKNTKGKSRGTKVNFDSQKANKPRHTVLEVTIMSHCILLADVLLLISFFKDN